MHQQSFPLNCKDQMLIFIKLLSPAKKHMVENPITAWDGEIYPILFLLLNKMTFLGSSYCGNLVDQGVFRLQGLFCIPPSSG